MGAIFSQPLRLPALPEKPVQPLVFWGLFLVARSLVHPAFLGVGGGGAGGMGTSILGSIHVG